METFVFGSVGGSHIEAHSLLSFVQHRLQGPSPLSCMSSKIRSHQELSPDFAQTKVECYRWILDSRLRCTSPGEQCHIRPRCYPQPVQSKCLLDNQKAHQH